jgi:hypothetical protein
MLSFHSADVLTGKLKFKYNGQAGAAEIRNAFAAGQQIDFQTGKPH